MVLKMYLIYIWVFYIVFLFLLFCGIVWISRSSSLIRSLRFESFCFSRFWVFVLVLEVIFFIVWGNWLYILCLMFCLIVLILVWVCVVLVLWWCFGSVFFCFCLFLLVLLFLFYLVCLGFSFFLLCF